MKIKLKINKSLHENIADYYEQAKETRKKIKGAEKAIEETKEVMKKAEKEKKEKEKEVKVKKEKKWYEKFHWFYTSGGKLAIGGKNAQQNDIVFGKYMEKDDMFFHADIQGGSAVILKDGVNASDEEMLEAAQFAGCFSNAWKNANAAVNVYSVGKEQLSKHATGGYIPTGAFAIKGERRWFNNTRLAMKVGIGEKGVEIIPDVMEKKLEKTIMLLPAKSGKEKGKLAKDIAKRLGISPDELLEILPSGKSKIK